MSQHHSARHTLFAALVSITSLASIAAHADDHQPRPGSFAAIMAIKDSSHFGPHLPAADAPSAATQPAAASLAAGGNGRSDLRGCDKPC